MAGCERGHTAKGLCAIHYTQQKRGYYSIRDPQLPNIAEKARELGISRQAVHQKLAPEKKRARRVLSKALKAGRVEKPATCSNCGEISARIEGHHEDYAKPLDVVWVCPSCHAIIHPHSGGVHYIKIPIAI